MPDSERATTRAPAASRGAVPNTTTQRDYWNAWNIEKAQRALSEVSERQKREALKRLSVLGRTDLNLLEVGCGAAWMTPWLKAFGAVTATDLSDGVVEDASRRIPHVAFVAGDFLELDFAPATFDVVVTFETLSHVPDQARFVAKIAALLRPGGYLILATQNRPVLERLNHVAPAAPAQIRRWVDRHELEALITPHLELLELFSVTPKANRGPWRILDAHAVSAALRAVGGGWIERWRERHWLGWTLMAVARKG